MRRYLISLVLGVVGLALAGCGTLPNGQIGIDLTGSTRFRQACNLAPALYLAGGTLYATGKIKASTWRKADTAYRTVIRPTCADPVITPEVGLERILAAYLELEGIVPEPERRAVIAASG